MKKYFFNIAVLFTLLLFSCQQRNTQREQRRYHHEETNEDTVKNWQWRGENRDGVYNETGLLKRWYSNGPQLLWTFEGLGEGYSSASIANEKLYTTGSLDGKLTLFVFDLLGQALAQKELGDEWSTGYNGPRSSVTINDGKLYIYSALGRLFCIDEITLDVVWTRDLFRDFD